MRDTLAEKLRIVIGVALAMVPRRVRRDYTDKLALTSDPARQKIADEVAKAVGQVFEIDEKPPDPLTPIRY